MILLTKTTRRRRIREDILEIGVFLADRKRHLDCNYLSLRNRVCLVDVGSYLAMIILSSWLVQEPNVRVAQARR